MPQSRIGVDVGGTKVAAALVDDEGAVLEHATLPTPAGGTSGDVLDAIARVARTVAGGREFAAVGVGTGGVVDAETGTIVSATDLLPGWTGTPVGAALRDRLGVPVFVDNDVNALATGELRFGGLAENTMLYVAIGTGIGGALIVDGALRHGTHRTAGGIGHMPVGGRRRCSCGRPGHLEARASGPAITHDYRGRSGEHAVPDLREVARRAGTGDRHAREAIDEGAAILGRALAGAANLFDVDFVVLGGGVAAIEGFPSAVREAFATDLLPPLRTVEVRTAKLGAYASMIGAAAIAFG